MTGFTSDLFRRRVPQIFFLYLGAAWVAVEFTDWLTSRYLLSNNLVDMVLAGMLSLVPAVLLLAWTHGAPGKDRWTRAERVGIPLNLMITAALLVTLFHGKELGAAAEAVTVIDERGQAVERLIPKPAFHRKLALFFFDNEGIDPGADWLQYGMTQLLVSDIKQDPFIGVWNPWGGFEGSNIAMLKRAGYDDGTGVPVSLLQRVAEEFYQQFFVTGEFTREGDDYVFVAQLYSVDPGRLVSEHEVRGADPMRLADVLSREIQEEITLIEGTGRINPDLPVAEVLTDSMTALRHFVDARMALLLDNDEEAAIDHFGNAVEVDPTFAMAYALMAELYQLTGNTTSALEAGRKALQHDYKLSGDARYTVKVQDYALRGDVDKALRVLEMWTELEPENPKAHTALGLNSLFVGDQKEKALASLRRARELGEDQVLIWEARIHDAMGNTQKALDSYRQHADRFPEDRQPWLLMGELYLRNGELEKAREATERAVLLSSGFVTPLVRLAELDLREGRVDEAWLNLEKATDVARDEGQLAVVTDEIVNWHDAQGQMQRAYEATRRRIELLRADHNPVIFVSMVAFELEHYVNAGRTEEAMALLGAYEGQIEPPYDRFLDLGYLQIHLHAGQSDAAEARLKPVIELIEEFRRDDFRYAIPLSRGAIQKQRGRLAEARQQLEQALALFQESIQSTFEGAEYRLWILVELAELTRMQGDLDAADGYLTRALRLWPWHARANLSLARLRLAQGRDEQARKALDRALHMWARADPDYGPAEAARSLRAAL